MTDIETQIEFFGKKFKVSEVTNPHLKKLLVKDYASEYNDHRENYVRYTVHYDNYNDWN